MDDSPEPEPERVVEETVIEASPEPAIQETDLGVSELPESDNLAVKPSPQVSRRAPGSPLPANASRGKRACGKAPTPLPDSPEPDEVPDSPEPAPSTTDRSAKKEEKQETKVDGVKDAALVEEDRPVPQDAAPMATGSDDDDDAIDGTAVVKAGSLVKRRYDAKAAPKKVANPADDGKPNFKKFRKSFYFGSKTGRARRRMVQTFKVAQGDMMAEEGREMAEDEARDEQQRQDKWDEEDAILDGRIKSGKRVGKAPTNRGGGSGGGGSSSSTQASASASSQFGGGGGGGNTKAKQKRKRNK